MISQKILACVVCLIYPSFIRSHENMVEPIVTVEEGKLKGVVGTSLDGGTFYKLFGIPYAKSPVKNLRFQPPQPPDSWKEIRDASKIGDACISRDDFTYDIVGSEDCLYLNVYTQSLPRTNSTLRPVMIFIHGGGLNVGSSNPKLYGPEFLMLKDIVLVTFNYRLGVLGFLSLDDPELGVPGNMGLKDQVMALKWVQKNIRNFNGDPNDVTLFGNSAGGSSVHAHILSPASKGLFHKAILQSGCALNSWFWGSKNNARGIVSRAGLKAETDKEALEILKNLKYSEIFAAQEKIYDSPYPSEKRPFSAVIEFPNDRAFLAKSPVDIIKEGNYNQVPMIMGYTENEGMLNDFDNWTAAKIGVKLPPLEFSKIIPINLNVTDGSDERTAILATLKKLYSGKPQENRYDAMTDSYMLVAIMESLKLHLENAVNPIYIYRVSLAGELNQLKRLMNRTHEPGVCHADELGYLFHSAITPAITPGSLEDKSIRTFVELWTNFATQGNPTPSNHLNVTWKPVESAGHISVLDIGEKLVMKNFPERERLEVWWNILQRWPLVNY